MAKRSCVSAESACYLCHQEGLFNGSPLIEVPCTTCKDKWVHQGCLLPAIADAERRRGRITAEHAGKWVELKCHLCRQQTLRIRVSSQYPPHDPLLKVFVKKLAHQTLGQVVDKLSAILNTIGPVLFLVLLIALSLLVFANSITLWVGTAYYFSISLSWKIYAMIAITDISTGFLTFYAMKSPTVVLAVIYPVWRWTQEVLFNPNPIEIDMISIFFARVGGMVGFITIEWLVHIYYEAKAAMPQPRIVADVPVDWRSHIGSATVRV